MHEMETPKSARKPRLTRHPTPRLSARKKSLFFDEEKVAGNDLLEGIKLLEASDASAEHSSLLSKSRRSIENLLEANCRADTISFLNVVPEVCATPLRRSPRTKAKAKLSQDAMNKSTSGKENAVQVKYAEEVADEQLHKIFNMSMRISSQNQSPNSCDPKQLEKQKRHHQNIEGNAGWSPLKKTRKYTLYDDELSAISTKKFYSASRPTKSCSNIQNTCNANVKYTSPTSSSNANISPRSRIRLSRRISGKLNINKGVRHKIRRPTRSNVPGSSHIRHAQFSSIDIDLILKNVRNEKLRNLIASKREERQNIEKIHDIFRRCPNPIEMARPLTVLSGKDDTNNNLNEKNSDASKMDADVVEDDDRDFSDIDSNSDEYEEISNAEEIIPLISHQPAVIEASITEREYEMRQDATPTKRKFFKTGRSYHTPKEVRITDNIKASICNGKLSLIQEEKKVKKKAKRRSSTTYDITDEQATVETILKNLDDTAYGDIVVVDTLPDKTEENEGNNFIESSTIQLSSDLNYSHFRNRLPYNTTDPSVIEQQHILLDFLINNNMCTEDNFTIFIADPDNHKEEAARIVDQVFVLVNEQDYFRQRIPYNTTDPKVESQQHRMLDFLITNNICTDENFEIFIANYNQRHKEADEIMAATRNKSKDISLASGFHDALNDAPKSQKENNTINTSNNFENGLLLEKTTETTQNSCIKPLIPPLPLHDSAEDSKDKLFPIFYTNRWKPLQQRCKRNIPRTWIMGRGSNQYQIDAGQRNFGAHQCKQCGLVYSIHEPEEEILHRDFHDSLNLLRFKGWIDEDIVAIYPEWGADGRILRVTETSNTRRHERLSDILTIVDKELGFSTSYIIPQTFVAYLAVRKFQIVGLCLVVPLEKANKYINVDGVDCCTEEEYPAKILRLYATINTPSENLKILATYIMCVYVPMYFNVKYYRSVVYGSALLGKFIRWTQYLPNNLRRVINNTIDNNSYFAHCENVLLSMLFDERKHIRKYALEKILYIRDNLFDPSLRAYVKPKINFDCTDYVHMINLNDNHELSEPPLTRGIPYEHLKAYFEDEGEEDPPLPDPNIPCHIQGTERYVQLVSNISKGAIHKNRERIMATTVESRSKVSRMESKQDLQGNL